MKNQRANCVIFEFLLDEAAHATVWNGIIVTE